MALDIPSNKNRLAAWLLLAIIAFMPAMGALAEPDALAFGDIRGYFEPCGCDPRTDLGGMARLSGLINREVRSNPGLMILNLGNYLTQNPIDPIKDRHIETALGEIPHAAVLLNSREMARELSGSGSAALIQRIPFVLSNTSQPMKGVRPEVVSKDWIISGFLSAVSSVGTKNLIGAKAFTKEVAQKRASKRRILLFSGTRKDLNEIANSKLFETIVSGKLADDEGQESPLGQLPDQNFVETNRGTNILFVPYGGQGVLRMGDMVANEAKSVSQILGNSDCKPSLLTADCQSTDAPTIRKKRVSWLDKDYLSSSTIAPIVESFANARTREFEERTKARLISPVKTPYVGASACKSCHPSSHQTWEATKHASAFSVLVGAGKHRDGECVSCHSVGYETGDGFVDESITPQFSNVQCENCHGPRKEHANNPAVKGPPANLESCKSCHFGQHSPEFDKEIFWRKIQHGPG
jgi:hypothetical protein